MDVPPVMSAPSPSWNFSLGSQSADELVTRPDRRAMRLRWAVNAVAICAGVGMVVAAPVTDARGGTYWGLIIGGILLVVGIAAGWAWQRRTWLSTDPALVVGADGMRIAYRGEPVWVPWTDVEAIFVDPGQGVARTPTLLFALRPDAAAALPDRPVDWGDRLFAHHAGALRYAVQHQQPPFPVVVETVHARWAAATGRG